MITEEEYLKSRIDDQIDWYNRKSGINKRNNLWSKGLVILFSGLISVLSGFPFDDNHTLKSILLGGLGALIAILSGLANLLKFSEKWVQYRTTAEALTQEKMLFGTLTGPYDEQPEPFKTLVERTESLISKEYSSWSQYINKDKDNK